MTQLILQNLETKTRSEVQINGEPVTVGRGNHCGICLADHAVSREHLTLQIVGQNLRVTDSSRNGTLVGGTLLRAAQLSVPLDTVLVLGRTRLTLVPEGAEHVAQRLQLAHARSSAVPASELGDSRALTSGPAQPSAMVVPPLEEPASAHAVSGVVYDGSADASLSIELRREIHRRLLEQLDLGANDLTRLDASALRPKVIRALRRILESLLTRIPDDVDADILLGELVDEALGLGPLEHLLADPSVSEIMVIDPQTIFVEKDGKCVRVATAFTDAERVHAVIERIVTPLGRRIDESSPLVDARLPDGSRVNAIIKPLALRGGCITIRKFPKTTLRFDHLVEFGSMTEAMARFLARSVRARKNIIISGGTGSGKTTLLNAMCASIPDEERIVTIEDAAELRLPQEHVVSLETRPPNLEGAGAYTIRDLVKNSLRMRPDRIIVGECRGGEALDMLQAMNTGHEGSLTTIHANSPKEALTRLETLSLMAGLDLPARAIREQIAGSIHLVVQQQRTQDGSRKITAITEVDGMTRDGRLLTRPLYVFTQEGIAADGKVMGDFEATGYLPSFLPEFIRRGLIAPGESYL